MSSAPSIGVVCTLAFRAARPCRARGAVIGARRILTQRGFADKATNDGSKLPEAQGANAVGPNMQQAEHVSEEASKMAKIMGEEGPDIEGQGTPVQDILAKEPDVKASAPKVMKQDSAAGKRSFSTFARRMQPEMTSGEQVPGQLDPSMIPTETQRALYASTASTPAVQQAGHKFELPAVPIPPQDRKNARDDAVVLQFTKLMMTSGKLARAQRWMAHILTVLRTNPAPTISPSRPLLPGSPPASHFPLDPVLYLTLAVDSIAPLLRMRSQKGAAGGGVALQIPVPLSLRQRRRTAFKWILDSASKKSSRGSGKTMFPQKIAEELVAVVEGRSAIWQRRDTVHRMGTTARINLNTSKTRRR